jgi:hypothetical protein
MTSPGCLFGDVRRDPKELHHRITLNGVGFDKVTTLEVAKRSEVRQLLSLAETS